MVLLATLFHRAARLRGRPAFHPRGIAFHGTWLPEPQTRALDGSPLVAEPAEAILRLSHGIGLPRQWPDILGLAVKLVDVHGPSRDQDLLFASTGSGPFGRHLLRPACDFTRVSFSTVLPYRVGRWRLPLVAHVGPTANTATYEEILTGGPNAVPLFNVYLGGIRGPRLARVVATGSVPDDIAAALRFDPWNTGPELEPVGRLNELRRPTYAASQDGRGAPTNGLLRHLRGRATARTRSGDDLRTSG